MANELVVPCWTRGRMWPTLVYFIGVSASSLRLYKGSHAAGPWIVALYSILIAVPVCRVLFKKRFVFTGQPKSIQCESRFAEILVNTLRGNAGHRIMQFFRCGNGRFWEPFCGHWWTYHWT